MSKGIASNESLFNQDRHMVTEDDRGANLSALQSKKFAYRQTKFKNNSIKGILNLPQMAGLPQAITNESQLDNRSRNLRGVQPRGNSLESNGTLGGKTDGFNPKSPVKPSGMSAVNLSVANGSQLGYMPTQTSNGQPSKKIKGVIDRKLLQIEQL